MFEASAQDVIVKKPKPILADSTDSLNFQAPVPIPRVNGRTNQKKPIVSENPIESIAPSPREKKTPTIPCKELSLMVEHNTKLYDAQSLRPKKHEKPSFYAMQPIHRRPTRMKAVKAASSMQLKEPQLKNNDPVTIHLDSNVINPPNQLSHKTLLKTKDEDISISRLCNEIGRLAQGCNNVKGKNKIFFMPKSSVLKGKRVTCARLI